jgi:GNAT superfamily N-acetyltransferase
MHIDKSPLGLQNDVITMTVAQPEDIPALQATAAATWWATYSEWESTTFIENLLARAYSATRLLAIMADQESYFLVVKSGDAMIGFGQVGPTMPRRDPAPVAPADLHRLYLLPAWQRRGIGSRLLGELEAWLRQQGYPCYGAYVHERNEPAKNFYARQGFVHKPECDVQAEWYLVKRLDQ